ncbi:hypothetical protein EfmAA55_22970 [Enterococcus faecium]|nr:hypothetical protein EfmAA55_22970 [Enterococcus faecium]
MVRMDNVSADFVIDGHEYGIEVGGMYNVYNALAATAVAEYFNVDPDKIKQGLGYDEKEDTFSVSKEAILYLT